MTSPTLDEARLLAHLKTHRDLGLEWVRRASLFYGKYPFDFEALLSAERVGWVQSAGLVVRLTEKGAAALATSSKGAQ